MKLIFLKGKYKFIKRKDYITWGKDDKNVFTIRLVFPAIGVLGIKI